MNKNDRKPSKSETLEHSTHRRRRAYWQFLHLIIPIEQGTDEDKKVVGNGLPKFTIPMTHAFRYKSFDLNLFFRGNFGYQMYDAQDLYYGLQNAAPNTNVFTKRIRISQE